MKTKYLCRSCKTTVIKQWGFVEVEAENGKDINETSKNWIAAKTIAEIGLASEQIKLKATGSVFEDTKYEITEVISNE